MRKDLWVISEINDLVSSYNTLRAIHRVTRVHVWVCMSKLVNDRKKQIEKATGRKNNELWCGREKIDRRLFTVCGLIH